MSMHMRRRSLANRSAVPGAALLVALAATGGSHAQSRFVGVGDLPGGPFYSEAAGLSADGSTVVGFSFGMIGIEGYRWTEAGGMVGLGPMPFATDEPIALAVNTDGSVIAGGGAVADRGVAFLWDEENGARSLADVLTGRGVDILGWQLTQVTGISADGLTLTGNGITPEGETESWIASIPEPLTGALLAVGLLGFGRRRR